MGFRSILSWAEEVNIRSGKANISFSKSHAEKFLQDIVDDSYEIADFLSERNEAKYPIAILRVPNLVELKYDDYQGYDTVISIRLKPTALDDVQKQIEKIINKETLVFLNNIDHIEIRSPKKNVEYKREFTSDGKIIVRSKNLSDHTKHWKKWDILRKAGEHNGKNYELAIAWTDKLDDKENSIYSYFKTDVKFPFPALVHGTFELSQDRNHLEKDTSGHNEFLTEELANLIINAALKISASYSVGYLPLRLLNIDFDNIDAVLQEFDFKEKMLAAVKQNQVFPNVNGSYFSHDRKPVYYEYPVARFLSGDNVNNLMPPCDDAGIVKFLRDIGIYHYNLQKFFSLVHARAMHFSTDEMAEVIYHLLTYSYYAKEIEDLEFNITQYPSILIDMDGALIDADANVFVQPEGGSDLSLPKFLKITFLNPSLFAGLATLFEDIGRDKLMQKLSRVGIKEYSFSRVSETLVEHYSEKYGLTNADVVLMHTYLFKLYRRESKQSEPARFRISTPVITEKGSIAFATDVYFGRAYGNELTEGLYSYDKTKLLAAPGNYRFPTTANDLLAKYFSWLGVAEFPRYRRVDKTLNKSNLYVEHVLRGLKYPYSNWGYSFKTYGEFYEWLPWSIDVGVMVFDGLEKILQRAKISLIMEWVDRDKRLKETLEKDRETDLRSNLYFLRYSYRTLSNHQMPSFTRWVISRAAFIPVLTGHKKVSPDKCCLSKTITEDFSPFVEKPKIAIAAIAIKLGLPETTVENYLALLGVHKEISSFSIAALYEVLNSLPVADKEGKAAKKIYREIINNFNEGKIDLQHPEYKKFISSGKVLARKGAVLDYFPVSESYYLPTKTYGSNVLKRFPLADIDSKQGPQRIERLFGVKRLRDISFGIDGTLTISKLNDEFHDDMERFKALVYVLRKDKDTGHEIAGRLRRLKIHLVVGLEPVFTYKNVSETFLLEEYEYVNTRKRTEFYISVPADIDSLEELRDSNKFCQSISEIFSTLIETEEYNDFIHDLYSKSLGAREPRLLSFMQKDDSHDLEESKQLLNVVDDIRFSFWRAVYYAKGLKGALEGKKALDLDDLLVKKLKLPVEIIQRFSIELLEDINDLGNLHETYNLFLEYGIDYGVFSRHFFSLDFQPFFKDKIEDLKLEYKDKFLNGLFMTLKDKDISQKSKYFEYVDKYGRIAYTKEAGFITDCFAFFTDSIESNFFFDLVAVDTGLDVDERLRQSLVDLSRQQVVIPNHLKEKKDIQSLLLFGEYEEIKRRIEAYQRSIDNSSPGASGRQVKVGDETFDFDDFANLAKQLLTSIDFGKVKIRPGKTTAIPESSKRPGDRHSNNNTRKVRFDKSAEELTGFISELICYQALIAKHGEENIKWTSENANRAYPDKFLTREAGSGYDLELKENGKVRFIEIKGTANAIKGIQMSNEEIRVALEFQDRYDLMIVEGPLTGQPIIRHVRNAFKFKKDETLFSNGKIKVLNDNYILKFKWED